jgi:hypothetical protein
VTEKPAPDPVDALHGDPPEPVPPMLQMDGIRIATLITLGAHTIAVIVLWVYLMTNVAQQRHINECYQRVVDGLVSWSSAAVEAGRSDRQAQREFLLSDDLPFPEARQRYLQQLDQADQTRSDAPAPTQRCTP